MSKEYYEFELTARERRKKEWEQVRDLHGKAKAGHIWRYYKYQILIIIFVILAVIFAAHQIYKAQFHDILYVGIVNDETVETEQMASDIREFLGPESRFETVTVDNAMTLTGDEAEAPAENTRLMTYIMIGEVDLVLCDEQVYALLQKEYIDTDNVYTVTSGNEVLAKYGIDAFDEWKLCLVNSAGDRENAMKYMGYILEKEEK